MSNSLDLQKVEHNARQATNQDGLVYLFLGVLLAATGLLLWDSRFAGVSPLFILLLFAFEPIRRRITYPRIGYVQFSAPRGFVAGILGFTAVTVAVLIFAAFAGNGRFQTFLPLLIAVVFALSMYFGASLNGIRRRDWATIGLMLASGLATTFLFDDWHQATAVQFWITAALLIIWGIVDLVRFIHTHPILDVPLPEEETS